jgi:hypothetical protein
MGVDLTSVDFETANSHRGSACSVGMVKVRAITCGRMSDAINPLSAGAAHQNQGFRVARELVPRI